MVVRARDLIAGLPIALGVAYASAACSRAPDAHVDAPRSCIDLADLPECSSEGWCSVDSLLGDPVGTTLPYMRPAVHGLADDDAWLSMGTVVFHFDGRRFTEAYRVEVPCPLCSPAPSVDAVYEAAPDDVWAAISSAASAPAAAGGTIVRLHGATREEIPTWLKGRAIAGTGSNDVWIVGDGGATHWDGSRFFDYAYADGDAPPYVTGILADVAVAGSDVWAVPVSQTCSGGCLPQSHACPCNPTGSPPSAILHLEAGIWKPFGRAGGWDPGTGAVGDVLALAAGDLWTTYGQVGGVTWTTAVDGGALAGSSDDDVWLMNRSTAGAPLLHWDGTTQRQVASPTVARLRSAWIGGSGSGYLTDEVGGVHRRDGEGFETLTGAFVPGPRPAIWGTGPNEIYAVGTNIARWDGCAWAAFEPFGTSHAITPFVSASDAPPPSSSGAPRQSQGIWGSGDEIWIVGRSAVDEVFAHHDAAGWHRVDGPSHAEFFSVWGAAQDDVWFGGQFVDDGGPSRPEPIARPAFLHWDGTALSRVEISGLVASPTKTGMLTGTAHDDVWAVANPQPSLDVRYHYPLELLHFDGVSWSVRTAPPVDEIEALAAVSRTELWASTPQAFFHFDGSTWTRIDPLVFTEALAISANGPDDVWFGEEYHWDGAHMDGAPLGPRDATLPQAKTSGLFRDGAHLWAATGEGSIRVRALR